MRVLGIVPARAGSKRLPRKNVLPLSGKPLVAHAILAALGASSLARVVVSSDDPEVLDELLTLFPELATNPDSGYGPAARPEVPAHVAALLVA